MDFRYHAFNNFYEYYVSKSISFEELLNKKLDLNANQLLRYKQLVSYADSNLETIQLYISEASFKWRFDRIKSVEKVSLILGTAELSMKLTNKNIVINEWVKTTDKHGTTEGAKFVNGILETVNTKF